MTIPSQHAVGDTGHTTDHNAIVDTLTAHEQDIELIQTAQPNYMLKAGGNVVNLTNPAGIAETIVIPAGTRTATAFVKTVTFGGKRTYGLDPYGQIRVDASTPAATPLEVSGYDATQTGDLQRWKQHGTGAVLARVGSNGTVYAPNITPGAWTSITLAAGVAWNSDLGARPQYRIIGDMVYLRGNIKKTTGTDFTVSPQDLGTLPGSVTPPAHVFSVQPAQFSSGPYFNVRMEVQVTGLIRMYFSAGNFTPSWVSLDGMSFSRTA